MGVRQQQPSFHWGQRGHIGRGFGRGRIMNYGVDRGDQSSTPQEQHIDSQPAGGAGQQETGIRDRQGAVQGQLSWADVAKK